MKYIIENKNSTYYKVINKIIETRQNEIFSFFDSDIIDLSFDIYVYDSIESLKDGMKRRGFKNSPNYMCACYKDEDDSLNFFEPKDNPTDNEWSKEEYDKVIFHELVHGIEHTIFGTTPEWINEGIAKYLDGSYCKGIKWLMDNYINNNEIPPQEEIETEFGKHNYDSYDYAYIMIKYILEKYGREYLIEMLKDSGKLNESKKDLLKKSIKYFNRDYKKILNDLILLIEQNHIECYFNISKDELNKFIEKTLKLYKLEDDYDFYYISNKIIKELVGEYDSHTKVIFNKKYNIIPIELSVIDGRVYLTNCEEENKNLLYNEVIKINDVDVEILKNEIESIISYSTEGWLEFNYEKILRSPLELLSLPSIKNDSKKISYTLKNKNGDITNIEYCSYFNSSFSFCKKYSFKNKKKDNYTYNLEDDIITIVYNSCREEHEGQMIDFINEIKRISDENSINKFIVDIRGNLGGNSNIIKPLIEFLKGKEVVTLVDKYVFSSGTFAICDLKKIGSKFVGTNIGATMNHFGESRLNECDDFGLITANKFFYFDEYFEMKEIESKQEFEIFKSNEKNHKYFEAQTFEPDYYAELTLQDYVNNNDSQKEKAKEILAIKEKSM